MVHLDDIYIDVHTHLFTNDEVSKINKCRILAINAGVDYETDLRVLYHYINNENLIPALGIHPENISNVITVQKSLELIPLFELPISEVGLDYFWIKDRELRKKQIEILEKILEIADKGSRPVILHIRGGMSDFINVIRSYNVKFAIHAYEGSLKDALKVVEIGGYISFPPVILRDKNRQYIMKNIPIDRILTETDSPYLSFEKGRKGEPCDVKYTIDFMSNEFGLRMSEVITNNFKHFVGNYLESAFQERRRVITYIEGILSNGSNKKTLQD
ncbi:TatD family hydrolase [Sulfolobales archaeon HS-7]|nr:TatD family hydrolase [Sulfolobales archaeon HS-7]